VEPRTASRRPPRVEDGARKAEEAVKSRRVIVPLNDYEWSIDKNVGAIANDLHHIVTSPRYDYLHDSRSSYIK
jgi:deoxyxylulose-5-phosphate synthase